MHVHAVYTVMELHRTAEHRLNQPGHMRVTHAGSKVGRRYMRKLQVVAEQRKLLALLYLV